MTMGNSNLTTALIIILCIDAVLFLGQLAIADINPDGPSFLNYEDSFISGFDAGNYTLDQENIANKLPTGEASVSAETGNIFTDLFSSARSWFLDTTGLGYVLNILGGPVTYLGYLGTPPGFTYAVAFIWYGLTLFLIVGFIFGRNT